MITIQCSRWSNLLSQHREGVGSEGRSVLAALVKGSGGDWHAGMQRGDLLQTPAVIKSSCKNALFWWEISGILSVIAENQTAASILLSPSVRMCRFRSKGLVHACFVAAHRGPTSTSVLVQWMCIISSISLKRLVYLKLGVGVLCVVIKASRKEKNDLMETFKYF